jgi:hypothetical protein
MHFYSILRLNLKQPFVVVGPSLAKILTKRHSHATLFHQGKRGLIAAKQGCWIGQSSTAEQRLGADVVSLPTFDCSSTQVSHTKRSAAGVTRLLANTQALSARGVRPSVLSALRP